MTEATTATEGTQAGRDVPRSAGAAAPLPDDAVRGAAQLARMPHPLVPLPDETHCRYVLRQPDGAQKLTDYFNHRGRLLWLMESDPLRYGGELPHWRDADAQLDAAQLVYVSGGKRASKTEWAMKRFVESCEAYGESKRWAFQDSIKTSIAMQQQLFWKYLSPELKALNGKKTMTFKIRWSRDGGFTDNMLVLPNGTEVYFLVYNADPKDYQGWELGARLREGEYKYSLTGDDKGGDKGGDKDRGRRRIQNIGAIMDENLTVTWLNTVRFRLATRGAKGIWTFSTIDGITNTIKTFLGTPKTLETRAASLLPGRVNLPGLPEGHMPYIQEPNWPRSRVIYFFTEWNPFSGYAEPGGVKELCKDKPSPFVMMNAYGYAEEVGRRAFPLFGEWNIIKPRDLPDTGTNYMVADPAGARNWFALWLRVGPGNPPNYYIYREWPDYKRFGEWAITSENPDLLDGDPGPAQRSVGYGPVEYKRLFWREETISNLPLPLSSSLSIPDLTTKEATKVATKVGEQNLDPYRLRVWKDHQGSHSRDRIDEGIAKANLDDAAVPTVRERIQERLIDPRAGKNQQATEAGGVCLIDKLAERNRKASGEVEAEPMYFMPARGVHIEDGLAQINTLLFWDKDKDLIPLINYPHLFVSEECQNTIWALQNWTGADGEKGASKDVIDALRYLVTWGPRHIEAGGKIKTSGGGSY